MEKVGQSLIAHCLPIQDQDAAPLGFVHEAEHFPPHSPVVVAEGLNAHVLAPIAGIELKSR